MRLSSASIRAPVFWLAALVAVVVACLPEPLPIASLPGDQVLHGLAFVVLSALSILAYPRASLVRIFLGLALLGGLIELVQATPLINREASLSDWLADILAAAVVLLPAAMIRRLRRSPQE